MISARKEKRSFDKLRTSGTDVWLPHRLHARLLAEARRALPDEACGLLLGRFGRIWTIRPARNVHPAPRTRFEIDPQALIDAHRAERGGGLRLLGYYHSHPAGEPVPSATDQAMATGDGRIWAIIGAQGQIRFWRDDAAGFQPLCYAVATR